MVRGNLANLAARGFFRSPKPNQSAHFIKRETQIARPPYEGPGAEVTIVIDATAPRCARRPRVYLDPLIIAYRLNVHASQLR